MNSTYMPEQTALPVIAPLIRRHVEDAAFYWSQHDASAYSPRLNLSGLARFSDLLDAHLEGVLVADSAGWPPTLAALERWKQPGEAFVCAYAALHRGDTEQLHALLEVVRARPDELLRGVISALAWVPPASAMVTIARWSQESSDSVMQVAALRAVALIGVDRISALAQALEQFLRSPNEHVRAAACRAAAVATQHDTLDAALSTCLQDSALAVRAEAAIALHQRSHSAGSMGAAQTSDARIALAETLWQCVLAQVPLHNGATGWYRKQTLRRLNRWVQQLAAMIPLGHPQLATLLAFMPARVGLRFVAYHGDPAHLPYVLSHMAAPDTARYAGWVWQSITGVDLIANSLTLPETEDSCTGISAAKLDADLGLPLPNASALMHGGFGAPEAGQRYLSGHLLTPSVALDCLATAAQAMRSIAAHYLQQCSPPLRIVVRGPAHQQMAMLERQHEALQQEQEQAA